MKVLYITNHIKCAQASGGFISDYLNDLTFYGFYELWKDGIITEIVDSTQIVSLYTDYKDKIPKQYIWGGMTAFWLIEKDEINRNLIEDKIRARYFDVVIYGNCRRCMDYYNLVMDVYPYDKVFFLDGNDDTDIVPHNDKHLYFKRELIVKSNNVLPISFSMPTNKFVKSVDKIQDYGTVIPGDNSTYIFKTESDYYRDYQKSYYGVTMKKSGWDCMRHYEIIGNYCMPYFVGLDKCPELCLYNFPKSMIKIGMELTTSDKFDIVSYYSVMDEVFEYSTKHLSTKGVAKYIMEHVK